MRFPSATLATLLLAPEPVPLDRLGPEAVWLAGQNRVDPVRHGRLAGRVPGQQPMDIGGDDGRSTHRGVMLGEMFQQDGWCPRGMWLMP